jgi:hypothetical protein
MKKVLGLAAVLAIFPLAGARAVPVPCPGATTLALLMGMTDGCFVQGLLFTNFAYSPGAADAALVQATSSFPLAAGPAGQGWTFAREGSWTSGFTLSYEVSVIGGSPGATIVASKDQIIGGLVPCAISVIDTQSATVLSVSGASLTSETSQVSYGGVTAVTTSCVVSVPSGSLLVKLSQQFFLSTSN